MKKLSPYKSVYRMNEMGNDLDGLQAQQQQQQQLQQAQQQVQQAPQQAPQQQQAAQQQAPSQLQQMNDMPIDNIGDDYSGEAVYDDDIVEPEVDDYSNFGGSMSEPVLEAQEQQSNQADQSNEEDDDDNEEVQEESIERLISEMDAVQNDIDQLVTEEEDSEEDDEPAE